MWVNTATTWMELFVLILTALLECSRRSGELDILKIDVVLQSDTCAPGIQLVHPKSTEQSQKHKHVYLWIHRRVSFIQATSVGKWAQIGLAWCVLRVQVRGFQYSRGRGKRIVRRTSPVSQQLQKLCFPRILSDCDEKFSKR